MPKSHSKKRSRDDELFARWDARPQSDFVTMGVGRDRLKAAQAELTGQIILPGDPTYDADRMLTNPKFSPAPNMIVVCRSENDVRVALSLVDSSPMPFTVRSGGHCTAGFSAGFGVLIDVKALDHVSVDKPNLRATVGTGCDFGTLNKTLAPYGVHVPGGECDGVCIGGFVQGGGLGFTSTTFGMNCDNAIEMRVMLADGSIVVANEAQNYDLWWAIRGGTGGNFGVLLSVTYKLYELGDVFGFALAWTLETEADLAPIANVMMLLQDRYFGDNEWGPGLNLQVLLVKQTIVDPQKPPSADPVWVSMVRGLWVGDPTLERAPMEPLLAMPGAIEQFTVTGDYTTVLNSLLNEPQEQPVIDPELGMPNEGKASRYVDRDLSAAEWATAFALFLNHSPNDYTYMYLEVYGGAIAAYPIDDSAFIHRSAKYDAVLDVFWYAPKDEAAAMAFLNQWIDFMETVWNNEVYQNYVSINVPDYPTNYWGAALPGLISVKQKYDPNRAFTFAQEVPNEPILGPDGSTKYIPQPVLKALGTAINYSGGLAPALQGG